MPESNPTSGLVPENTGLSGLIPKYEDVQADGLKGAAFVAGQTTPDRAGEAINLAKKYGTSTDFAHQNLDELKADSTKIDFSGLVPKYPGAAQFYQNPDNASVGHDDVENAKLIDESSRMYKSNFLGDLGNAFGVGFHELSKTIYQLGASKGFVDTEFADQVISQVSQRQKERRDVEPNYASDLKKVLGEQGGDLNKAWKKYLEAYDPTKYKGPDVTIADFGNTIGEALDWGYQFVSRPKAAAYLAAEQLALGIPAIGAAAAAAPVGAVAAGSALFLGGYLTETGARINEKLESEGVDMTSAASLQAARKDPSFSKKIDEASLEALGPASFDLVTALVTGGISRFAKPTSIAGKIVKGTTQLGVESLGEGGGEFTAQAIRHEGDLSKVDLNEVMTEFAVSGGQSLGTVAITESTQKAREQFSSKPTQALGEVSQKTAEAMKTVENLYALQKLGTAVTESKIATRVPEKVEELIRASNGDGNVYFQPAQWNEYWQSKGVSPVEMAQKLGVDINVIQETGAEIVIPMAKFVSSMAKTEHYGPLLSFIRTTPGGMTFNDAQEHMAVMPGVVKQITTEASQVQDEAKVEAQKVKDQLLAAGRPEVEAEAARQVFESRLKARSSITGISPSEYATRYGLEIQEDKLADEPAVTDIAAQAEMGQPAIQYTPQKGLEADEVFVEKKLAEKLGDTEKAKAAYKSNPKTKNGKIIDTDIVREQSDDFIKEPMGYSRATHAPSSAFAWQLLQEAIAAPVRAARAVLMAGSGGSGKGTISGGFTDAFLDGTDFVYDSTLRNFDDAVELIDQILASGRKVQINYIYKPLELAAQHIIARAGENGRTVPPPSLAQAFVGAQETIFKLAEKYKGNDLVIFDYFDNSEGNPKVTTLSELKKKRYIVGDESEQDAIERARKVVEPIFAEKQKQLIDKRRRLLEAFQSTDLRQPEIGAKGTLFQAWQIAPPFFSKLQQDIQSKLGNSATVEDAKVHSIKLTPALKKTALEQGFPLFQPGEIPRGSIRFNEYNALIRLGAKADASTFMHEAFHLWTKEFIDDFKTVSALPEKTPRQEQFLKDVETYAKFVGAESIENMSREQWEKAADAFEQYLKEGKAPSSQLAAAFRRFKAWLTKLYRMMTVRGVQISDEIRSVFDRMIAAEEEIMQEATEVLPTEGMTPKQAAEYTELVSNLRHYSEDRLRATLMKEAEREQTKEYRDREEQVRTDVTDELINNPTYQALESLKRGFLDDGTPMKLNREEIVQLFGDEYVSGLPKGIFSKELGVPAEYAAEVFGFTSAEDMLHSIADAPTLESAIDFVTDQRMKELYPSLMEEPAISDEAVKAMHNEKRSQMLRIEAEHLFTLSEAKKVIRDITRKPPTDMEVRSRAEEIIGSKNIEDISLHEYEMAERRARKLAGDLLAKGDVEGAYRAKRQELLNHELFKAADSALTLVDKSIKQFKKVAKKDEDIAKNRDGDLVNAARALLAQFGFGKPADKAPMDYLKTVLAYDKDKFAAIEALVGPVSGEAQAYRGMSFDEFSRLRSAFDAIWSMAKTEKELVIDERRQYKEVATEKLGAQADKLEKRKKSAAFEKSLSHWEKHKVDLQAYLASGRIMESLIDELDRGDINGAFREYLFTPVNEGVEKYRSAKKSVEAELDAALKTIKASAKTGKIEAAELGYQFQNKSFLLGAMLHTGNESNKSKLLRGYGWATENEDGSLDTRNWDAFVKRMEDTGVLTEKDYDFLQSVWNIFEKIKPDAQKAHYDMYGYRFSEITSQPFTKFGKQYEGGYVPAKADPYASGAAELRDQKNAMDGIENAWAFPTTGRGFTKSRVESYAAPLQTDLSFIPAALDWSLRFAHIEPAVKQTAKLLFDPQIRSIINSVHPYAINSVMVPWLQRASSQRVTEPGKYKALDTVARFLRRSATLQYLFLDVSNAAQQSTGLITATIKVEPKHLRNGFVDFIKSPKETMKMIHEKSTFMRHHNSDQLVNIEESIHEISMNPSIFDKTGKLVDKAAPMLSKAVQHIVDVTVWLGAYNEAHAKMDIDVDAITAEKRAIRSADSAVRLTQGSGMPEHVSAWAVGTPAQRVLVMFFNWVNTMGNLQVAEYAKAKGGGRRAYNYLVGLAAPVIVATLIRQILSGDIDKDDDGKVADDILLQSLFGLTSVGFSQIPVAGGVANSMFYAIANQNPQGANISISPLFSALERGTKGLVVRKETSGQQIQDIMTLFGTATGLPLAPVSRPISYIVDVKKRNIKKPRNPIEAARGLVTGRGEKIKK